jgi:hypothetical protein
VDADLAWTQWVQNLRDDIRNHTPKDLDAIGEETIILDPSATRLTCFVNEGRFSGRMMLRFLVDESEQEKRYV